MEIIESFSNLIDSLAKSLEMGKEINYSAVPVSGQSAVGVFLSRIPSYRQHLKKKLQEDYKSKKNTLKPEGREEARFKDFGIYCKKVVRLAEINSVHFARFQRNYIRRAIEKTRKWAFKSISTLQKEKCYCQIMMQNSSSSYQLKLKEFIDNYSWKKFFHYLQVISSGFARTSEKKLFKGMKEKTEEFLMRSVKILRHACIENLYCHETDKKGQMKLSNYSTGIQDVEELFSKFLMLQSSSASIIQCKKAYRHETLLTRSSNPYTVISHLSNPLWRPLTLHFYIEATGELLQAFTPEFSIDCSQPSGSLSVSSWHSSSSAIILTLSESSSTFTLSPAALSHLLSSQQLFYLDIPRFSRSQDVTVRPLSPLQQKELIRIYTTYNSPILYKEIIPEADSLAFSHDYVLASSSLSTKVGSSSRHWLIQLQKEINKQPELSICAWEGCFASKAVAPVEFKVNDMGKTRKKLKKIVGNEFCRFHQCVNLAGGNKVKTNPNDLWTAVQAGLLWQNSLRPSSVLGKIAFNKSSQLIQGFLDYRPLTINSYKSERQLDIEKAIASPKSCKKLRERLLREISEMKKAKEFELRATEELKRLSEYSVLNSSMRKELKNSFQLDSEEKLLGFSRVREKALRMSQSDISRNISNRSSRPSSAAREKQKEEIIKKRDSKLLASPYLQQIPDKGPSFRLKQVSNTSKVPKSRSFAILDF